jgi:transposase
MPILADEVDAVIGGDTHRDSHALEMAAPNGGTIGTLAIGNDETGYTDAIAWITQNAPGPRVVIGLEGTRSYGVGLSRALQAAGFLVLEVEQPRRADRRRGKSDPIDAHLAALQVLRMPADRKALPRSDGDREALRILLVARREMTTAKTQQINRLRALLLTGGDADRELCRGAMSDAHLQLIPAAAAAPTRPRSSRSAAAKRADWRWRSAKRPAHWPRTRSNSPNWSPPSRRD